MREKRNCHSGTHRGLTNGYVSNSVARLPPAACRHERRQQIRCINNIMAYRYGVGHLVASVHLCSLPLLFVSGQHDISHRGRQCGVRLGKYSLGVMDLSEFRCLYASVCVGAGLTVNHLHLDRNAESGRTRNPAS